MDGDHAIGRGKADAWVEAVLPLAIGPAARHRHAVQRHAHRRHVDARRRFEVDPPGIAIGPHAPPDQLAANLHQTMAIAAARQFVGDCIGGIALGDARQVERDTTRLPQPRRARIPAQAAPAPCRADPIDRRRVRNGLRPLGTMPPEIDEMPDRWIEGAIAQRRDA